MMYCLLGTTLMTVGLIGYAFQPPPHYVGSGKAIVSICLYYSILALFLISEALCDFFKISLFLEIPFAFLLLYVTVCGLNFLRKFWVFNLERVKDCLLYGSVVYLMDRQLSGYSHPLLLDISMLILALCLVAMLVYVLVTYRRIRFFMAFDDYQLVSIAYMTTFLLGMYVGKFTEILPYALAMLINLYSFYVVIRKYIRPLI